MVDYIRVYFALLVVCIFSPGSNGLNSGGGMQYVSSFCNWESVVVSFVPFVSFFFFPFRICVYCIQHIHI